MVLSLVLRVFHPLLPCRSFLDSSEVTGKGWTVFFVGKLGVNTLLPKVHSPSFIGVAPKIVDRRPVFTLSFATLSGCS